MRTQGPIGAEGLTPAELESELQAGARLVRFDWVVSLCVLTFSQPSAVHLIRAGQGTFWRSLPCTLVTLALGWWAIPFGPLFTIAVVFLNLKGGTDVTGEVLGRGSPEAKPAPPTPGGPSPWQRFKNAT